MGNALTGAERHQRAGERLSEARGQLAAIEARLATNQSALDSLQKLEQSADAQVTDAEDAVDAAAERVTDLHAQVLVAVGSDDEAQLTADHGAAIDARKAARAALDQARSGLEQTRAKVASESAPIKQQMAEDDETKRDVSRLISSLERAQVKAHHDAGVERLAAAKERHAQLHARLTEQRQAVADTQRDLDAHHDELQAIAKEHPELAKTRDHAELADPSRAAREICDDLLAFLDTLERHRGHSEAIQVWHAGQYLPSTIANAQFWKPNVLHDLLMDRGHANQHAGLIRSMRAGVQDLLDKGAKERAHTVAQLPAVGE